jgi:phosphoribosyl-AMP cyclohydrolase
MTSNVSLSEHEAWLNTLRWDENGLLPAIAQDAQTGDILMVAWMNREALHETATTRRAVYFSRSRKRLWRKGEESGHAQTVLDIRTDCDADVILLKVEQQGGIACHTGRRSCFFNQLTTDTNAKHLQWTAVESVLKAPETIYGHTHE